MATKRIRNRPSLLLLFVHIFLTVITSGGWLIVLIIWWGMKLTKKR